MLFIIDYIDIILCAIGNLTEHTMKRILYIRSSLFEGNGASSQLIMKLAQAVTPESRYAVA